MKALNKQALTAERMEWLKKLADIEYCKNNPGHWLMSLTETNLLATLALSSVELGVSLEAAEKRIAELEARTVTLPDVEKWRSVDAVRAQNAYKVLVSKVLAAAGIGVKGE